MCDGPKKAPVAKQGLFRVGAAQALFLLNLGVSGCQDALVAAAARKKTGYKQMA